MIAITGAAGFVGRNLTPELARDDAVRSLVRTGSTDRAPTRDVVEIPDLLDRAQLAEAFRGAQHVVHLAGRAHRLHDDAADPEAEFRRINVGGTEAVVEAAARAGVRRVLLASSLKAVGEGNETPWDETTAPRPADAYGRSKLEAERVALDAGRRLGVEIVVMRFPLVYGPGVPANVRRLLGLVDRGVPLPFGLVRNRRSMLFTGNLAETVRLLLQAPVDGRVFFLSDGHDLSTPDLIRTIASALGKPARLIAVPQPALVAMGWMGDVVSKLVPFPVTSAEIQRLTGSLAVNIDALRSATGYVPKFTVAEGWKETAAWYRARAG
jgi:nucleoside-diphosphate-sugar epimerase